MDARRRTTALTGTFVLAAALAGCGAGASDGDASESDPGVVYGLGDDHALWRWEVGADAAESVLDLGEVWTFEGDVGGVLNASLAIAPDQRHAAWIAGGTTDAELHIADLNTGETTGTVPYPVDHACLDPAWLADGSSLLVHRAEVWPEPAEGDQMPMPTESWGPVEWYASDAEVLPATVDVDDGCRMRWYTAGDGSAEGLYRNLETTELHRVDATGAILETIELADLQGIEPEAIDLVAVDPAGQYACLADGYDEHGGYEGGFTARPQEGTTIVDLSSGEVAGAEDSNCESLAVDGYLSRDDETVSFIDYDGETLWEHDLPPELANAPSLYYFPSA